MWIHKQLYYTQQQYRKGQSNTVVRDRQGSRLAARIRDGSQAEIKTGSKQSQSRKQAKIRAGGRGSQITNGPGNNKISVHRNNAQK